MTFWEILSFWRMSFAGVVLAGGLCGFVGVYVLLRRVVFVGAALTQMSGVGVALAFYLASYVAADPHGHPSWLSPQLFALAAAIGGALVFSAKPGGRRVAPETVMGVGWIVSSALLLLLLSSKRIVQEAHEVDDLLYGTGVLLSRSDVVTLASVGAVTLAVHIAFYRELIFTTYDREMARALGYRVRFWDLLLYATFGVVTALAVRAVGALPAFGFLVIPAASAQLLVRSVRWLIPLAVLFGMAGGALGFMLAVDCDLPTGASIVAASSTFLVPGILAGALPLLRRLLGRGPA